MKVISFGSGKGGVGKTTSAMLMTQIWRRRFSVVAIDLNPIPQLSDWAAALGIAAVHWDDVRVAQLVKSLHQLENNVDIVVIDIPPASSEAIGAAIACSNAIIIPFQATAWEMRGLEVLLAAIGHTKKLRREPLTVIGLPCRSDVRQREARVEAKSLPFKIVYAPPIHRRVEIERAASAHSDLFVPTPVTKAQAEIQACSDAVLKYLTSNSN